MEHESAQERFWRLAEAAKSGESGALIEAAEAAKAMLDESRTEDAERTQRLLKQYEEARKPAADA